MRVEKGWQTTAKPVACHFSGSMHGERRVDASIEEKLSATFSPATSPSLYICMNDAHLGVQERRPANREDQAKNNIK